jgi:hypothetical protein
MQIHHYLTHIVLVFHCMFYTPPFTQHHARGGGPSGPPPVTVPNPLIHFRSDNCSPLSAPQNFTVTRVSDGAYSTDDTVVCKVYPYVIVAGSKVFSPNFAQATLTFAQNNSCASWSWDAVYGADGYRLINNNTGAGDQYQDVTTTALVDNISGGSYAYGYTGVWTPGGTVTPVQSATTTVLDLSGNGYNAVQATAANKPVVIYSQLNGQPCIRFDGVNDGVETSVFTQQNTALTILAVGQLRSTANGQYLFQLRTDGPLSGGPRAGMAFTTSGGFFTLRSEVPTSYTSGLATNTNPFVALIQIPYGSSTATLRINGATVLTTSFFASGIDDVRLGSGQSSGPAAAVDWYQFKVWTSTLTSAQYRQEEAAALSFYGLGSGGSLLMWSPGQCLCPKPGDQLAYAYS